MTQLPKDGTVHELTSNVLMFLEQLLEYTDTIGRVLKQDPTYNAQLEKLHSNDKNKALLGLYISNKTFLLAAVNFIILFQKKY